MEQRAVVWVVWLEKAWYMMTGERYTMVRGGKLPGAADVTMAMEYSMFQGQKHM